VFDPFFDFIGAILAAYYSVVPNYALAIAMLTVTIMAVLTPLTIKGTRSMMELQVLQPEMKRIQQQYRGDREAMNREMVALYSRHGVNPLSGCLPNLVQIPVFLVLFQVLNGLTNDPPRHINETTRLYQDLEANTPVEMVSFGVDLARSANDVVRESFVEAIPYLLMFAVYFGLIFVQQRQMAARRAGQPSQISSQQQLIIKYLPYVFTIFAFFFQAGLVVYFITSTLWRIGQQAYIHRRYPSTLGEVVETTAEETTPPAKRAASEAASAPPPGITPSKKAQASGGEGASRSAAERRVAAARERRKTGKSTGSGGAPAPTSRTGGSAKNRKRR
jgi:YidC/Oxa1 family membrane protein insertase